MERLLLCALVCVPFFDAADASNANLQGHRAWSLETQPSHDASLCPQEERQRLESSGERRTCGPAAASRSGKFPVDLPRWPTDGSPEANASIPAGGEANDPSANDSAYYGYVLLFTLFLMVTLGCCFCCLASRRYPLTAALQMPERYRLRKADPPLCPQGYGAVAHTTSQSADGQDSAPMGERTPLLDSATSQEDALPSASLGVRAKHKSVSGTTTVEIEDSV